MADAQFSLSEASESLVDSMDQPQQHAIDQAEADRAQSQPETKTDDSPRDSTGAQFDPSIHSQDRDGNGILNESGRWRKRRKSRGGVGPSPSTLGGATPAAEPTGPSQSDLAAHAGGRACSDLFVTLSMMLGGMEWQPGVRAGQGPGGEKVELDEKQFLDNAFGNYFVAKQWGDLPPGLALATAVLFYAAPRFQMPVTRARILSVSQKIKLWWVNRKLKKHGMRAYFTEDGQMREEPIRNDTGVKQREKGPSDSGAAANAGTSN